MDIEGKIIKVLPLVSGVKNDKEWKNQQYVLLTNDLRYPKHIVFSAFNEKVDNFAIKEGDELVVSIEIDAKEYKGKWYNSVNAWKVVRNQPYGTTAQQVHQAPIAQAVNNSSVADLSGDLPF